MDLAKATQPTNNRAPPIIISAKGTLPGTLPLTALDKYDLLDNIRCVPSGYIGSSTLRPSDAVGATLAKIFTYACHILRDGVAILRGYFFSSFFLSAPLCFSFSALRAAFCSGVSFAFAALRAAFCSGVSFACNGAPFHGARPFPGEQCSYLIDLLGASHQIRNLRIPFRHNYYYINQCRDGTVRTSNRRCTRNRN